MTDLRRTGTNRGITVTVIDHRTDHRNRKIASDEPRRRRLRSLENRTAPRDQGGKLVRKRLERRHDRLTGEYDVEDA